MEHEWVLPDQPTVQNCGSWNCATECEHPDETATIGCMLDTYEEADRTEQTTRPIHNRFNHPGHHLAKGSSIASNPSTTSPALCPNRKKLTSSAVTSTVLSVAIARVRTIPRADPPNHTSRVEGSILN